MWMYTPSDELYHYGVLGMKWGVRKMRKDLKTTAKGYKQAVKDAKTKEEKKAAKAEYKKWANMGRTKGEQWLDTLFANPHDVRAYMHAGMSHSEAFKRSFGDKMLTAGIIATVAKVGSRIASKVINKKRAASRIDLDDLEIKL